MRVFRVFLSSPGDVAEERQIAHEILQRLPQEPAWRGKIHIEIVRWDNPYSPTPLYANFTPQEAVNRNLPTPSECDIIVVILWARFGTPLSEPARPDGSRYLSGTEWEYENAISGHGRVLVYRRMDEPQVNLRDPDFDEKREQLTLVDKFFERFFNPTDAPLGAYISYHDLSEYERNFKTGIEATVRQLLETEIPTSQAELVKLNEKLSHELDEKQREIETLKQAITLTRLQSRSPEPTVNLSEQGSTSSNRQPPQVEVAELTQGHVGWLRREPSVVGVAPVVPMKLVAPIRRYESKTVRSHDSWGVSAVGAESSPFTGNGVTVALLDSGIDSEHPAFAGVTLEQRDFTGEGNGDQNGHGTHVAGIVLGRPINGFRIGVAPGINRALVGKVCGTLGSSTDRLLQAIHWAVDNGADVILISVRADAHFLMQTYLEADLNSEAAIFRVVEAIDSNTHLLENMIRIANVTRPVSIVAAVGNEGNLAPRMFPANIPEVLSVAAIGQTDKGYAVTSFSNTGASLCAPGEGILSAAVGGGLTILSGTSIAAAHVAGIAALWAEKARSDGLDPQVTQSLLSSATRDSLPTGPPDTGAGLVLAPQ